MRQPNENKSSILNNNTDIKKAAIRLLLIFYGLCFFIENKVDFSQNKNLMVAAVTVILGTGDFALSFGSFNLGGIGTATFAALLLNWFFGLADKKA